MNQTLTRRWQLMILSRNRTHFHEWRSAYDARDFVKLMENQAKGERLVRLENYVLSRYKRMTPLP